MTHAPTPEPATPSSDARTRTNTGITPAKASSREPQALVDERVQTKPALTKAGAITLDTTRPDAGPSGVVASDATPSRETASHTAPQPKAGSAQATPPKTTPTKISRAKTRTRTPTKRRRAHPRWRDVFLEQLAETSNVAAAARVAGVDTSTVYKARRTEGEFLRRWHDALAEGYDNLEMELVRRLRSGELDGGGKGTGGTARRKFDNAVAIRLLTAHRESVSRQRGRRAFEDEDAIIASINARLEAMRQRLIAAGTPGLEGE